MMEATRVKSVPHFQSRFRWIHLGESSDWTDDGSDVVYGLSQPAKTLPCRYLYDDLGSDFFEQICDLPEYYPTRTEQAILTHHARAIATTTGHCELVELGSGSSRKTRTLLDAYRDLGYPLYYSPIDVSVGMLETTALDLLGEYPEMHLCGLAGTYEQALAHLPATQLERRLVIFLGSTIGNLSEQDCQTFLAHVGRSLQPGDYFLLGADLQKPINILEAAYDDAQGVTAAFNLNILRHINWRFGANFDVSQFMHKSFYNTDLNQIEMHLVSLTDQVVKFDDLDLTVSLKTNETIHTEISRKFDLSNLIQTLTTHHLMPVRIMTDSQKWFSLLLCQRT